MNNFCVKFENACLNDDLQSFVKTNRDILYDNSKRFKLFQLSSENGHLGVAKWIYENDICNNDSNMTCNNNINVMRTWNTNQCLLAACENGHLEIAKWLSQTFQNYFHQVTNIINRFHFHTILRKTCYNEHLDMTYLPATLYIIFNKTLQTVLVMLVNQDILKLWTGLC